MEKFKTISAIEVKASCEKAYWKLDYARLNEKKKLTEWVRGEEKWKELAEWKNWPSLSWPDSAADVDEFLKPIAEQWPFYIRDATDFIKQIKVLGRLPVECYLATLDVSSLYRNIDIDEGLTVVQEELIKTNRAKPSQS